MNLIWQETLSPRLARTEPKCVQCASIISSRKFVCVCVCFSLFLEIGGIISSRMDGTHPAEERNCTVEEFFFNCSPCACNAFLESDLF